MLDTAHGRRRGLAACRSCSSRDLRIFLDLGQQPLANALVDHVDIQEVEPHFPLQLVFCGGCSLVQTTETIPPDVLFARDYPYFSSFSRALLEHSRAHVQLLLRERPLGPASLVVEVASNDGYLLRNFIDAGIPVLGIDPAAGPVASARERGVPTMQAFFGAALARELAANGQHADVVIANNVAAHVDSINDFMEGFAILLKDDGIARIEVAYLRDMIENCEFDTVYHEHLFYWSISAMQHLVTRHGLQMNDAERLPIHGGSIRFTLSKRPGRTSRLDTLLEEESALGMSDFAYYTSFSAQVAELRDTLHETVQQIRAGGHRLAAYGAAAKGATLLNYMQFEPGVIEYVVDRNPAKIGKYLPGVKLPIRAVETLTLDKPDYVLVLAWNFAREIIAENKDYTSLGGRFILPVEERQSL